MNKEQQELLDEAYEKYLEYTINGIETGLDKIKGYLDGCLVEYDVYYEHFTNPSFAYGYRTYNQEEFINKCKTDFEFSQRWGLKIEERTTLEQVDQTNPVLKGSTTLYPRKLITITYNDTKLESYE